MIDIMTPSMLNYNKIKHGRCHVSDEPKCKKCGEQFFRVRSNQVFCSPNCATSWFWENKFNDLRKAKREVHHKKCRQCGVDIETTNPWKVYCSDKCKVQYLNKARSGKRYELRVCPVCQKEFMHLQMAGVGKIYCSPICRNKAGNDRRKSLSSERSFRMRKTNQWNGNWYKALERDNFTCQLCGKKQPPGQRNHKEIYQMVVHHWDGSHNRKSGTGNHSLDNLVTFCQECHNLFHTHIHLVKINGEFRMKGDIFAKLGITEIKVMS